MKTNTFPNSISSVLEVDGYGESHGMVTPGLADLKSGDLGSKKTRKSKPRLFPDFDFLVFDFPVYEFPALPFSDRQDPPPPALHHTHLLQVSIDVLVAKPVVLK